MVLHRAFYGSFERFIAVLLEHFDGALPLWLSPEQVRVLPVSDAYAPYAAEVVAELERAGLRARLDARPNPLGYRLREGIARKVPYLLVVGEKELADGSVAVRRRGERKADSQPVREFAEHAGRLDRERSLIL